MLASLAGPGLRLIGGGAQQRVQAVELALLGERRLGERLGAGIDLRQRRSAQKEVRSKAFDRPIHHAARVEGLDLADRRHRQGFERAVGRESVHDVAEGVLGGAQAALDVDIDAPMLHVLAVMVARR